MTEDFDRIEPRCKHCYVNAEGHVKDKCLYGPTTFEVVGCPGCGEPITFWGHTTRAFVKAYVPFLCKVCDPERPQWG